MNEKDAQVVREFALAIIFGVLGAWVLAAIAIIVVGIVKVLS